MANGKARDIAARDTAAGAGEYLGGLLDAACDLALTLDTGDRITAVAGNTLGQRLPHWPGRRIADVLTVESLPKLETALQTFRAEGRVPRPVELNHDDGGAWEVPVRYSFHPHPDGSSVLMLGRDLSVVAETQAQLVQAQLSLEEGYEARREFDARYRLLLRAVDDPIVFVSVADGRIKDLNDPAAMLLGSSREDLSGAVFANEFTNRGREALLDALVDAAISDNAQPVTATSRRDDAEIAFAPQVFRAGGERVLILRLETRGTEGPVEGPVHLRGDFAGLFANGADAMVITSATGIVQSANDAFLEMIDAAHLIDVKGRKFSDFLSRGQVDMNVLLENARRTGKMRFYSTKAVNEYGAETAVEMSATLISNDTTPHFGFVIRDTSRIDSMRRTQMHASEESSRNVMELVGSATLKEIVAETTDVVEKMCIETAVNLTRNNRVAAAEMLGLSRQSLYVKLRKYDLLTRDGSDQD
ncbi:MULTISPECIES: transcriptional regulator PpsR [unclassified Roseivivax]|uniref:transcriptional regulator PpsR n=1 Tax=Roseivivax sp. GX 12232 TaxID=2900547 RepID=UPI001E43C9BB|nr:transcriptional regulator PpsR [Roseivivax sp. GX 12232]MCE0506247.1 transcriptional regulator PpsR [Roseivivax sp. GX 12232]